jgi:hypothetical protein
MELELFFNGKVHGLGPRHCGPAARLGPRWNEALWTVGVAAPRRCVAR